MRQTLLFYNLNSIFMKKIYLFAALATMLAACSENDLTAEKQVVQQNAEEDAVNFDVYIGRGLTRGGVNGVVENDNLKNPSDAHGISGFGVFGYYTDGEPYSAITKPNFFYNQQVAWNGTTWLYNPIKYWPNEFGNDAKSDQVDRVTLFAYLPWVEVDPLTGVVKPSGSPASPATDPTTNITGMTRNTATGDPFIKYTATMDPNNSVDLCYGVAAATYTSSNSAVNQNNIAKGKPYVDVVKPGTDANSKIKFDFKHATAQLRVTIDAVVNNLTNGANDIDLNETRIWVRSVTFTGITQKGALNLHSDANEGPEWYDVNGNSKITTGSLTVFDGRKDDKEANDKASNETPATLNTQIVQAKQYKLADGTGYITEPTETGVVKARYNLFNSSDLNAPVFVIPTKEKMRVTIVYDVETVDKNLPYYLSDGKTPGSTIQNTIYKDIETFGEITAGYCYTLNLHLGMRTVDFDAEVTPWQYYGADVDLPSNLQAFAAVSISESDEKAEKFVTIPAGTEASSVYDFAITGLKTNESVTHSHYSHTGSAEFASAATENSADGMGVAKQRITIAKNEYVVNRTTSEKWASATGKVIVKFTQLAAPLGLGIQNVNGKTIKVTKTTSSEWNQAIGDGTDQNKVKVWKNGMLMSVVTGTPSADNQVQFAAASGFTFKNNLNPGDIVTIWMKAGDAAEESVTANIAGIAFAEPNVTYTGKKNTTISGQYPIIYGQGRLSGWTSSVSTGTNPVTGISDEGKLTLINSAQDASNVVISVTFTPATGYYLNDGNTSQTESYTANITVVTE